MLGATSAAYLRHIQGSSSQAARFGTEVTAINWLSLGSAIAVDSSMIDPLLFALDSFDTSDKLWIFEAAGVNLEWSR